MAGYIGSKAAVVSSGAERKKTFDITTSTTSLTGLSYTVGQVHVFHNGVRLVDGTDYTATNSTSITLTAAAENGDQVVVVSYASFQAADAYTKTEADAGFVAKSGDTMTGNLDVDGTITATSFSGDGSALAGVGASTTAGDVGTYAWLARNGNTAGIVAGDTLAGSSLVFASVDSISSYSYNTVLSAVQGASPSGTWRIMGTTHNSGQPTKGCLFVRIS